MPDYSPPLPDARAPASCRVLAPSSRRGAVPNAAAIHWPGRGEISAAAPVPGAHSSMRPGAGGGEKVGSGGPAHLPRCPNAWGSRTAAGDSGGARPGRAESAGSWDPSAEVQVPGPLLSRPRWSRAMWARLSRFARGAWVLSVTKILVCTTWEGLAILSTSKISFDPGSKPGKKGKAGDLRAGFELRAADANFFQGVLSSTTS